MVEAFDVPNLNLGAVTSTDYSCPPPDGFADPGETLTLNLPLSNPFCATPATGVTVSVDGGASSVMGISPQGRLRRRESFHRPGGGGLREPVGRERCHHEQPWDCDQDIQPADRQAGGRDFGQLQRQHRGSDSRRQLGGYSDQRDRCRRGGRRQRQSIFATDAIRSEGNSATTPFVFTVARTGDTSAAASANWAVTGTANAADLGGTPPSGSVTFAPGATSAQILVNVSGDAAFEPDETFTVTLSNAVGAAIGVATANGRIINDDAGAPLSFLVSSDASGNVGNGDSGAVQDWIDISSDGRYVAFASQANNLVPDDTNNAIDVFVKDTWTGAISRVSTTSAGAQGSIFSVQAAISGDGRLAAFINGNSFDSAHTGFNDVYVKDLASGATIWATNMPGFSRAGETDLAFSDNGRSIAYTTFKTLLPPGVDNFTGDVFVADLQSPGSFVRASSTSTGAIANSDSSEGSISGDGRFVAFTSTATNLATNDANGAAFDVYAKDLATGAVQLVSANAAGEGGNGQSLRPDVSANGRYVAFYSNSSNLVADDTNGGADIFRKDLVTGAIQRVNTLADGSQVQFPGGLATNSEVSISG